MLTIAGRSGGRFCDGFSRRDFLRIGGLACAGLTIPQLLRAEGSMGMGKSHKSVIMIFLAGGPAHQDLFDLKPDAPDGIRGEFRPIATDVPGLEICEHMPRLAAMMSKFVLIRSLVGAGPEHSAGQCLTGYKDAVSRAQGGRPSLGAVMSELQGPVTPDIPPFVGLAPRTGHSPWGNPGEPGYLGLAHAPFTPYRSEPSDSRAIPGNFSGLSLDEPTIVPARLAGRRSLLTQLENLRLRIEHSEAIEEMDTYTRQAFDILSSRRVFEALDLDREDPRLRAKYGIGDMINERDGAPCCMNQFLMARRLVEAGVRVVTNSFGRWDTHSDNFGSNRRRMPKLDMGLSALVEDLHLRGMDNDVSVVVWGEFGRSPLINKKAGRDHWQPVSFALLAGGGMRTGQVIGSTDKLAAYPKDRPVWFQNVFATLYHNLGIDPATIVPDRAGRPMALLDDREPIREVI
jgi:hypothetical protein